MSEEPVTDDQSHYEVSLTAGQAFLAFVLLLLSLAASFAFGLMIGRSAGDDRLMAQTSPSSVDEAGVATKKPRERIVELTVPDDEFRQPEPAADVKQPPAADRKPAPPLTIKEEPMPAAAPASTPPASRPTKVEAVATTAAGPHYAQLLSTGDQKKAESLAARLIDGGFLSTHVERTASEKGMLFRVRVNFPSEQDARAAEPKLKSFSSEVWITKQ